MPTKPRCRRGPHVRRLSRLACWLAAPLLLCACGLGDVGSSAATAAKLKAQEAEQAKAAQVQITNQLDAAQQQAEQRRKEIEAATR